MDWRACVPPAAGNVAIVEMSGAGHTTIGSNPYAQAEMARFLARAFAR